MAEKVKKLHVEDLTVSFRTTQGLVRAVRGVTFNLYEGETLAIVGESGSGKSVSSRTIMGILAGNGIIDKGQIIYEGEDLTKVDEDHFHEIRGNRIGMIFQDPMSSLNPIMRIGRQITEGMILNGKRLENRYKALFNDERVTYNRLKRDRRLSKVNYNLEVKNSLQGLCDGLPDLKDDITDINDRMKTLTTDIEDAKKILAAKLDKAAPEDYPRLKEESAQNKLAMQEELETLKQKKAELIAQNKPAIESYLATKKIELDSLQAQIAEELPIARNALRVRKAEAKAIIRKEWADEQARVNGLIAEVQEKYNNLIAEFDFQGKLADLKAKETEALTGANPEDAAKIKQEFKQKYAQLNGDFKALKREGRDEVEQLRESLRRFKKVTKKEAFERAIQVMEEVGIPEPHKRFRQYPFQFSGGMRQRIVIAIALTASPDVLICDEPTTALDVTIQAQILELINNLKVERNLSVIFITHDLGVVANMADRIAVMYAGKIVELGTAEDVFYDPRHPYTWALLASMPDLESKERLTAIPGTPPNMLFPPKGDAFADRNKYALKIDFELEPPMFKVSDTHSAATWLLHEMAPKVEMPQVIKDRIDRMLQQSEVAE
jgi:oligopeptide transport system ATP-binding protein